MKTFLPLILTCIFFSSCFTYQYLTISNSSATINGKQFTATDSTLQVSYLFDSLNGRIGLVINNQSKQPVTIDWKKSSLITNGNAVSMYDNNVLFYAAKDSNQFIQNNLTIFTGGAILPEGSDFIPPNAVIKRYTKTVVHNINNTTFDENEKLKKTGSDYSEEKFKGKKYTENESPYKLRVYLTYIVNNTEKVLETTFYASEIVTSSFDPDVMSSIYYKNQPLIYK